MAQFFKVIIDNKEVFLNPDQIAALEVERAFFGSSYILKLSDGTSYQLTPREGKKLMSKMNDHNDEQSTTVIFHLFKNRTRHIQMLRGCRNRYPLSIPGYQLMIQLGTCSRWGYTRQQILTKREEIHIYFKAMSFIKGMVIFLYIRLISK